MNQPVADTPANRRRHPGLRNVLLVPLLLLVTTGCTPGLLTQPAEPPGVYLIDTLPTDLPLPRRPTGQAGPGIAVSTVRSAAGFGSSDMLYVKEPHHLQTFARHRWADRPARMLEPLLVTLLERSGLFAGVSGPGSQARSALRLDTELRRLQQVFDGADSRVELVVRVALLDTRARRLRASQLFRVTVAADPSPYGGVQAANRAAALFGDELLRFLERFLQQDPP